MSWFSFFLKKQLHKKCVKMKPVQNHKQILKHKLPFAFFFQLKVKPMALIIFVYFFKQEVCCLKEQRCISWTASQWAKVPFKLSRLRKIESDAESDREERQGGEESLSKWWNKERFNTVILKRHAAVSIFKNPICFDRRAFSFQTIWQRYLYLASLLSRSKTKKK